MEWTHATGGEHELRELDGHGLDSELLPADPVSLPVLASESLTPIP